MEQGPWQRSRCRAPRRDRTPFPAVRPTVEEFEGRVLLAAFPLGDINAGTTASSNPAGLVQPGGCVYFTANDAASVALGKTDGTPAGTELVANNATGGLDSLAAVGATVFFTGFDANGAELWKTDGTPGGTELVKDIIPGTASSVPFNLTAAASKLYFLTDDGSAGTQLWVSDGTEGGTTLLKNFGTTGAPLNLTAVGDTLFFTAVDPTTGRELWRSDGTEAGTDLVEDILAGPVGSEPVSLVEVNGTLFFRATDSVRGLELWKSDGTEAGTELVKDVNPVPSDTVGPSELTPVGNTLFFTADDGTGRRVWKSDGTDGGTVPLPDLGAEPDNLTAVGGKLFFAMRPSAGVTVLAVSDGTVGGTTLLKEFTHGAGATPAGFTAVGNLLFFVADDGTHGAELWKSDGTVLGTVMVEEINPGPGGITQSFASVQTAAVGDTLYFTVLQPFEAFGLWRSDGTDAGTSLVRDISARNLTAAGGKLFLTVFGAEGEEPWVSDGTFAGTVLVQDINPGVGSSSPTDLTDVGGMLFFTADDGTTSAEPWRLPDAQSAGAPTATWAAVADTNTAVDTVTITFNKAVQNVSLADFTLDGVALDTLLNVTLTPGPGNSYTLDGLAATTVIGNPNTTYALALAAGNDIRDLDNHAVSNAPTESWLMDTTVPTVTVIPAADQANPTSEAPVRFTVVFSEAVSGFDETRVAVGGTAGFASFEVTPDGPNDGTTYLVTVTGMSQSGTVTVAVEAGSVADPRGNGNAASDVGSVAFPVATPTVPPAPPAPIPPPLPVVFGSRVFRKRGSVRREFIRIADSAGRSREVPSPLPSTTFRAIRVVAIDTDGNGVADAVRVTAKNNRGKDVSRIFTL